MVGAQEPSGTRACCIRDIKIVPYCPRCGTPLSSHEVAQGYKDVKERSAIVRFQAEGRGKRLSPGLDHHPLDPAL